MSTFTIIILVSLIPFSYLAMYLSEWTTFGGVIKDPKEKRKIREFLKRDDLGLNPYNDGIISSRKESGKIRYIGTQKPFLPYYSPCYYVCYKQNGGMSKYSGALGIARRIRRSSDLEELVEDKYEELKSRD